MRSIGLPSVEGTPGEVHIGNELSKLLNVTDKLAQERGDSLHFGELFLLAAVQSKGDLGRILEKAGAVKGAIAKAIEEVAAAARSTTRTPRRNAKRSRNTPSISLRAPSRRSSIPSSAATTKSAARFRCCSGARRTTPC